MIHRWYRVRLLETVSCGSSGVAVGMEEDAMKGERGETKTRMREKMPFILLIMLKINLII